MLHTLYFIMKFSLKINKRKKNVQNSAQLSVIIHNYDVNLKTSQKFLKTILILRTTTVADIFYTRIKILAK